MTYLLDTNALIWGAIDCKKLGRKTLQILMTERNVFFSSLSAAEINIKTAKKRTFTGQQVIEWAVSEGFQELGFTSSHAEQISRFGSLAKHDPFDRMILAQAAGDRLTLLTADETLLGLSFDWVQDSRV